MRHGAIDLVGLAPVTRGHSAPKEVFYKESRYWTVGEQDAEQRSLTVSAFIKKGDEREEAAGGNPFSITRRDAKTLVV
jgi:hypothetical protein